MSRILYLSVIENPVNNGIIMSQSISLMSEVQKTSENRFIFFSVPSKKLFLRNSQAERDGFIKHLQLNNIDSIIMPIPFLSNHAIRIIFLPFLLSFILPKLLLTVYLRDIEIIHSRSYPASLIGLIAALLCRKKHIFDMRGVYPEEGEFLFPSWHRKSLNFKGWKFLEQWMLKYSDHIVVVSNSFRDFIMAEYQNLKEVLHAKISVIPCGTRYDSVDFICRSSLSHPIQFVYSGTLDGWTTPQLLAKVFKKLIESNNVELHLNIYTHTASATVEKAFRNELIPRYSYDIESLNAKEVKQKLLQNNFGILVREKSIVNEVSFPVKFGEYMASGLPTVTNAATKGINQFIYTYKVGVVMEDVNFKLDDLFNNYIIYRNYCLESKKVLDSNVIVKSYSTVYLNLTDNVD